MHLSINGSHFRVKPSSLKSYDVARRRANGIARRKVMGSAVSLRMMTDSLRSHNSNPRKKASPHAALGVGRHRELDFKNPGHLSIVSSDPFQTLPLASLPNECWSERTKQIYKKILTTT
jgi:hypothetical protein